MKELSSQAKIDRKLAQRSLYYLCKEILGYKDMVPHVHGDLCYFATHPDYGRFRQATLPRSFFKTWVWTVGKSIWLTLPDEEKLYQKIYPYKGANARILIASNVIDNAAKMVNKIKREWETNDRLQEAFPELVPEFNKTRWSDSCAEVKRTIVATEGTYTAVGAGGSVISQHFDHIIEDDLIYAKKDDFTGAELMPNQEDIDKAIGWHKLSFSLFSDPRTSCLDNVGTRWAPKDLIWYIRKYEDKYTCFEMAATKDGTRDGEPVWPERYSREGINEIFKSQGTKIAETQYLNRPRADEDVVFRVEWLNQHDNRNVFPENLEYYTIVDLAGWGDSKGLARNVILTGAKDHRNHLWVARVDVGRFNPSEVIDLFKIHRKQFNSRVMIEEIQYQRAVRHFARQEMEKPGEEWYNIDPIPYDGRKGAKDLRIRALEPLAKNGGLHVMTSMKELRDEFEDYPYGRTVDILDCLGYLLRHARTSSSVDVPLGKEEWTMEAIEEELRNRASSSAGYPFDIQIKRGTFNQN